MDSDTHEQGMILIADDTPANLSVLFDFLTQAGLRILVAEDGVSAVQIAEYAAPDLILLDILMPGMDGFETCRRLKASDRTREIPVIFLTALTETVDKVKGFELGAVDYITKPLQAEEVLARIQLHLSLRALNQQLQEQNQQLEQEIAARKQIEHHLQHQAAELTAWKNHYEALILASRQILYDWNPQTNGVIYSGSLQKILGYSPEEMVDGLNQWMALIHPDDQPCFSAEIERILSTQEPLHLEYRVRRKDQTYIPVEDHGYFFLSGTGDVKRMVGFVTDISDRKQAERRIQEQAALLDITTDAIFVQDLDNKVLFWNRGSEQLYGWSSQDVLGQSTLQLLAGETLPQFLRAHKAVLQYGEWQGRLSQVTHDGRKITVESRWTLMQEETRPKSVLVVNTDITEQQQLESQFLRTQRMQSLGTLAGGIAHDLNNLLTPILSSAQLLLMQPSMVAEKQKLLLQTVETSAKRGATLVQQVLSFARGVEGKRTVLQAQHIVAEVKHIALETLSKRIKIKTDVAPDLWMISGDATQLNQVLINLCINAQDAMPRGGVLSISAANVLLDDEYVRLHLDAKVGPYIQITVADTGTGIPAEIMDHVFEPFFTTKDVGKGTGLGLSTVHMIVKSHGGFIDVESWVGQGTRFKVYLPAIQAVETLPTQDSKVSPGKGELILFVDDEAAIREANQALLEAYNYRVLTACDGVEAVALYAKHRQTINLVLVDMMMPSMDGSMAIRTLRKINPSLKIIAVSGLLLDTQMPEAARDDIRAFLPKPYTTQDLLETIDQVLCSAEV